jgi:signal transduction histidine kinase
MPATEFERSRRVAVRLTVRLRLTLLYGALFIVSGAALLGITYVLVASDPSHQLHVLITWQPRQVVSEGVHAADARRVVLRELLTGSAIALGIMSTISMALGWLMAGRVLRPFDGLLGRLDAAFEAQKRFVANASHELRTPLTLQRTLIEVALSDPNANATSLRALCTRLLSAGEQQERLIEALLTLASSQRGLDHHESVDLAALVDGVLRDQRREHINGTRIESTLRPAWTSGAPHLIERLATNLVDNALRHNVPDGWVHIATVAESGRSVLRISNSGPIIAPRGVDVLFQPFQRGSRNDHRDGHGLGLSIVAAIAAAHEADLCASALPAGGLMLEIRFPQVGPQQ